MKTRRTAQKMPAAWARTQAVGASTSSHRRRSGAFGARHSSTEHRLVFIKEHSTQPWCKGRAAAQLSRGLRPVQQPWRPLWLGAAAACCGVTINLNLTVATACAAAAVASAKFFALVPWLLNAHGMDDFFYSFHEARRGGYAGLFRCQTLVFGDGGSAGKDQQRRRVLHEGAHPLKGRPTVTPARSGNRGRPARSSPRTHPADQVSTPSP